eukprot:scaffold73754_cov22-Cyclotella_meneghiniana.AAC.2
MAGHICKLNIVVNLKLRYEMITGQPVTHKLALGKDVGVNTILGMPFIDKFQCMYDGYNEVVEAKILDTSPFKVTRMVPQRYNTGDRAPSDKCCNHSSADILDALRKCSDFMDGTSVATVATAEVKDGNSVTLGGSILDSEDSGSEAVPGTPISRGSILWGKAKASTPPAPNKRARFAEDGVPESTLRNDWTSDA